MSYFNKDLETMLVTREGTMDEVEVNIEINNNLFEGLKKETGLEEIMKHDKIQGAHQLLKKKIKEEIGLSMKISLSLPGTIPRSEGGKLNPILDLRKK